MKKRKEWIGLFCQQRRLLKKKEINKLKEQTKEQNIERNKARQIYAKAIGLHEYLLF